MVDLVNSDCLRCQALDRTWCAGTETNHIKHSSAIPTKVHDKHLKVKAMASGARRWIDASVQSAEPQDDAHLRGAVGHNSIFHHIGSSAGDAGQTRLSGCRPAEVSSKLRVRPYWCSNGDPLIHAYTIGAGVRPSWCRNGDPLVYMYVFANCLIFKCAQLRYQFGSRHMSVDEKQS